MTRTTLTQQWLAVFILLLIGLSASAVLPSAVYAQSYRFEVPEVIMEVVIQPDSTAEIYYTITFNNLGSTIDIVDIGLPHGNYNISNMTAAVNGVPVSDIRVSEVIDIGVEIHLGAQSIPSGTNGTLEFSAIMPELVYQDTTNADLASVQITPMWFGSEFVSGETNLSIIIYPPRGTDLEQTLFQDVAFTNKVEIEGQPAVIWQTTRPFTSQYRVGVSFPKGDMTGVIQMSNWDLAVKWLEDNPGTHGFLLISALIAFAFMFLRFSGGTGISVLVVLAGLLLWFMWSTIGLVIFILPLVVLGAGANEYFLQKRKKSYLPAIAHIEGGGIKRGLTAPEAAIILEEPLNKVLTLVLFGLLKKRVVELVTDQPLVVRVAKPYRATQKESLKARKAARLKVAQAENSLIHDYEHPFLDVLEKDAGKGVSEIDFSGPMKAFVKHTAVRVSGFNLNETRDYYQKIIQRALKEAETMGDIPEWEKTVDRNAEWILMSDNYPTVFERPGRVYRPTWYRPVMMGRGSGGQTVSSPSPSPSLPSSGPGGSTGFGDVAASFAGFTQNTMTGFANTLTPGSINLNTASGLVNLGGADRFTAEVMKGLAESSRSSGSGGSSGGGCACACAGCACACACAGGGR